MKTIFKMILGLFITVIIFNSGCKKDESTPAAKPGNLRVLVSDSGHLTFFGGVDVFLYLTDADRTNDPQRTNYYQKTTSDNSDPMNIGAVFYNIAAKKHYVFARRDVGGGNYLTGVGDATVKSDSTVSITVEIQ